MPPTYLPADQGTGGFYWDPFGDGARYVPQQNIDPKTGKPYPYINPATGQPRPVAPPTPINTYSTQAADTTATRNNALIEAIMRANGDLVGASNNATITDNNALEKLQQGTANARAGYQGVANNVRNTATNYNNASAGLWGQNATYQMGLNGIDAGIVGDYFNQTNPLMQQLTARGSDPADIQRQLQSYGVASGIAGGSLDYNAAQYASNPADMQRQLQSYNDLQGVGGGSLDYQAAQAQAVLAKVTHAQAVLAQTAQYASNPADLQRQLDSLEAIKKDLQSGGAEQKAAMEKFKGLSDPEVTAKERFLSEVARREFESGDKSSRDAVSSNLAARGLRSGGQQIAQQQATRQQLSQDRLLKELGIQAGAVDRSMQALQGWGQMSNAIRASDQTGLGLQANQTNAIRDMNDRVGMFNTGEQNTTNRFNAGLQTDVNMFNANASNQISMHNSAMQTNTNQFNAAQTNQARANNQATRLAGYQGAAQQSNAIRSANDTVGMFNTGQTNQAYANNQSTRLSGAGLQAAQSNAIRSANDSMTQFQDTFRQNEAQRVGNLAGQRAGIGLGATAQMGGRAQTVTDTGLDVLGTNYGRDQDANKADWDTIGKGLDLDAIDYGALTGTADREVARKGGVLSGTIGTAGGVVTLADDIYRKRLEALGIGEGQKIVGL